ncbi:MAG: recombinase family protein [Candidatus Riflebacteria bacterium]|nr:recombinase family protein [Candidatus Riflebacteria bacterium]
MGESQRDTPRPGAILYLRCSSVGQAEKDLSIPAQRRHCEEFAVREGYEVKKVFEDPGISGTTDSRPGFQAAIQFAYETAGVKAFVVYDTSRFARNRMDALKYKLELRKAGIKILYSTQTIGDDPDGELMEGLLELMDARYSKVLGRMALRGMKEKARKGLRPGGRAPHGYRLLRDDEPRESIGNMALEPLEAQAVKLMFELASQGLGKKAIVEEMDRQGFRAREGGSFSKSGVGAMLRNPVYRGDLVFNKYGHGLAGKGPKDASEFIVVEGVFPAIVSAEQWEQVQDQRLSRMPSETPPGAVITPHVFTSLARCAKCGAGLTVESSYGQMGVAYTYYSCSSRKKKAKRTCPGVRVRTDRVEPVILDFIYSKLLSDDSIREVVEKLKGLKGTLAEEHGRERSRIEAELTRLKAKLSKLLDLYEDNKLDRSTLDERLATLQEKKKGLEERFAALPVSPDASQFEVPGRLMREYRDGLRELLDGRSPVQTRSFLSRFIEEIRISETQAVIVGRLDKARCTSKRVAGASLRPGWLLE